MQHSSNHGGTVVNRLMGSTLRQRNTAHSVRLQVLMNAQHKAEIGERIKELRDNSAETNRSIAEYVGVGERSVAAWIAGGGITYDNAKKVAELFGVDEDYVWRGRRKPETPDLIGALNGPGEEHPALARIEAKVTRIEDRQVRLLAEFGKLQASLASRSDTQRPAESPPASAGTE